MSSDKKKATVQVPTKDPNKKDDDKKNNNNVIAGVDPPKDPLIIDDKDKKSKKKDDDDGLSQEDIELRDRLSSLVLGVLNPDYISVGAAALDLLKKEIRSSTSSMTSVPKPLKFLKDDYADIKSFYNHVIVSLKTSNILAYRSYSDLMSILAMTMEEPQTRLCLKYRLESSIKLMTEWGTQYMKHLTAEIRIEMELRLAAENDPDKTADLIEEDSIMDVVDCICSYYMSHNAEHDAIDLLLEVERKELILTYTSSHNVGRVCSYLRSCASYLPPPDDIEIYSICFDLYLKFQNYYHACRFALKLDNKKLVRQVMRSCVNRPLMKRQCAYLLGWHQYGYDEDDEDDISDDEKLQYPVKDLDPEPYEIEFQKRIDGDDDDDDDDNDDDDDDIPDVNDIIGNQSLSEAFHSLARDLDVLDPKDAEQDIFREQLIGSDQKDNISGSTDVISARKSLAISYVNAFVNAGFGRDKFMMSSGANSGDNNVTVANDWISKNKERGQLASVASIGTIMLWDEESANCVDRYFESGQAHIRAGAYLAIGISCSGMKSESGVGYALLSSPALNEDGKKTKIERLCAILGLGLAYAGEGDAANDVYETLQEMVSTEEAEDISSLTALCLGYIYVGTCNDEVCNIILADLMEREPDKLNNPLYLLNILGLSLLFLGKQDEVEVPLEAACVFDDLNPTFAKTLKVCLECLAYAGTGNVLKIQKMLGILGEHFDDDKDKDDDKKDDDKKDDDDKKNDDDDDDDDDDKKDKYEDYRYFQSIATLGISIIALGEDLGTRMTLRMYNHLIQYGNIRVKRSVPLALAMISVSNPLLEISDTLSKLSHDNDDIVSRNAIFGLGLIAAGTNNARIARMLRALTEYYQKEADHLYIIRIAQGLVHLGKGLLTVKCFHSDRFLLSKVSICGILTTLFCNIGTPYKPKVDKTATAGAATPTWNGNTISLLSNFHYLLYTLNLCIKPRMLITLDCDKLKPFATSVRVGQALDTVGQAGVQRKRITGFQTHNTPILLAYKDRAELASDEYVSISSVLEGFAILRLNPNSEQKIKERKRLKKLAAAAIKDKNKNKDKDNNNNDNKPVVAAAVTAPVVDPDKQKP